MSKQKQTAFMLAVFFAMLIAGYGVFVAWDARKEAESIRKTVKNEHPDNSGGSSDDGGNTSNSG